MQEELGGDRSRTADPNWPKVYSVPYGVMLDKYYGVAGWGTAESHVCRYQVLS